MKLGKILIRVILLLTVVCMVISGFYIYKGYKMYRQALSEKSLEEMVESIQNNSDYTILVDLPQIYIDAVIAVEDYRFYKHYGIDLIAIGTALWNDIKTFSTVQGGSTITQQLAKNQYFTQDKVMERKIAEVFMAFYMEKSLNKDEILELYLNSIYFGEGYYCVREASLGYFNKEPKDMSAYESTLLAGIPNAPSVYSPITNPVLAAERQKQVLDQMVKRKYLTEEEVDHILNQVE